jgi:hypothetical protein
LTDVLGLAVMPRPSYPLDALRKLRDERAEAQAQSLAEQVARSQQAELCLQQRRAACQAHSQRTQASLQPERERLAAGKLSGADLQRQIEFQAAAREQAALLERAEREAAEALGRERAEEQRLRQELSRAEADAQLVRNHEATFHERVTEQRQRAEEEAALEQWNARRP